MSYLQIYHQHVKQNVNMLLLVLRVKKNTALRKSCILQSTSKLHDGLLILVICNYSPGRATSNCDFYRTTLQCGAHGEDTHFSRRVYWMWLASVIFWFCHVRHTAVLSKYLWHRQVQRPILQQARAPRTLVLTGQLAILDTVPRRKCAEEGIRGYYSIRGSMRWSTRTLWAGNLQRMPMVPYQMVDNDTVATTQDISMHNQLTVLADSNVKWNTSRDWLHAVEIALPHVSSTSSA